MNAQPYTSTPRKMRKMRKIPYKNGSNVLKNTASSTGKEEQPSDDDAAISSRQARIILAHLRCGLTITQPEASELYGIWRLGARIWDLRNKGINITTSRIQFGNRRIGQYKLLTDN